MKNKLLYNVLLFICVLIFQRLCQIHVYKNGEKLLKDTKPLPDILHTYFDNKNLYVNKILCKDEIGLSDSITFSFTLLTILYLLKNKKLEIINETLKIFSILFLLRSITFNMTILPVPAPCSFKLINGGCHDLIFSGHYIFLTVTLYIILNLKINIYFKFFSVIMFIISLISTLTCKRHYTVDIILSVTLSILFCIIFLKNKL
jgi:hypothetical protein